MIPTRAVSRRTLLRGLGASVALPYLEAMTPRGRAAESARPPVRLAFLYVPNGVYMPEWTPAEVGATVRSSGDSAGGFRM